MAACHRVLATVELRELILVEAPIEDLLRAQRVCQAFKNTIDQSNTIQQKLFFRYSGSEDGGGKPALNEFLFGWRYPLHQKKVLRWYEHANYYRAKDGVREGVLRLITNGHFVGPRLNGTWRKMYPTRGLCDISIGFQIGYSEQPKFIIKTKDKTMGEIEDMVEESRDSWIRDNAEEYAAIMESWRQVSERCERERVEMKARQARAAEVAVKA